MTRCIPCNAGTYTDQPRAQGCNACTPGSFALWGASTCTICQAGTFTEQDAATRCQDCPIGLWAYQESTACTQCENGKYSITARAGDPSLCLDCPGGYYSTTSAATAASVCQLCGVGLQSSPGATTCTSCPQNTYTGPLGPGCLACPAFSTSPAGASLDQCVCIGGFLRAWSDNRQWFTCYGCSAGTYTTRNNASACGSCSAGKYAIYGNATGMNGLETEVCSSCSSGHFSGAAGQTECTPCSAGRFASAAGQSACTACPPGFFGAALGATVCQSCSPGRFTSSSGALNCSDCVAGKFSALERASACQNCSLGSFSESRAATDCLLCGAGAYSTIPGLDNASHCQQCQQGSFSTGIGATSRQACRKCPVGFTTPAGGTSCFSCPEGQFPNQMYGACASCPMHSISSNNISSPEGCRCGPGYFLGYNSKALGGEESYEQGSNGWVYKLHTFHTYDEGILVVAEAALGISCNGRQTVPPYLWRPNYYPPVATPSTCQLPMVMSYPVDVVFDESETSTHMQCVPCPRGTFSANGGTEDDCIPCPSGQYQDEAGRSSCDGCPPGSYAYDGGDACIPCEMGKYQVGEACVQCPEGYFTLGIGVTACIPCPNNMWSSNTSGGCRNCPYDAVSPGGTGVEGCLCPPGNYLFMFRNTPYCVKCEAGTYAAALGANRCTPCPAGTFGNISGLDACFPCALNPGRISTGGATSCTTCGPGTIPASNQGGCVPCPVGKYCSGNSSMADCPPGSYMTTGNITSLAGCQKCPANFFCGTAITKDACPTGTFSNEGSMDKHDCQCLPQYDCTYSTVTTKKIALAITPEEFEAQRAQFIAALAAALGVSVSSIKIVSVQASGQPSRRVLRPAIQGGAKTTANLRQTTVTVISKTRASPPEMDTAISQFIRKQGFPALQVITTNKTLDF